MPEPVGFFTDTTVCIGCKACQVACHQWNDSAGRQGRRAQPAGADRQQLRQHRQLLRRQLAARQVHRAVQPRCRPQPGRLADDVGRVQALRQRPVPGGLSDRGDPADRVRHGVHQRAGLQRLPRLRVGLPVRRDPHEPQDRTSPRNARSVTTGSKRA